jgi:hypothetical protein
MSMYNLVHGVNQLSPVLLAMLDLQLSDVPRFRDAYWNGTHICIYTRTGGGNREEYAVENDALAAHPHYVRDEDDDFDSTYATFYFTVPAEYQELTVEVPVADATPSQRWQTFFEALSQKGAASDDPQITRVREGLKPLMDQIAKTVKGDPE